jgi:hypothetical protein
VDILYWLAQERGRQLKSLWLVPQGFGWPELPRDSPQDAGDTKQSHTGMALKVHWIVAPGGSVPETRPGAVRARRSKNGSPLASSLDVYT